MPISDLHMCPSPACGCRATGTLSPYSAWPFPASPLAFPPRPPRCPATTRHTEPHAVECSASHETPAGGENLPGIVIEDNQDPDCFSIRYTDPCSGEQDLIHFCDWPALKAAIDRHQAERGGKT